MSKKQGSSKSIAVRAELVLTVMLSSEEWQALSHEKTADDIMENPIEVARLAAEVAALSYSYYMDLNPLSILYRNWPSTAITEVYPKSILITKGK